MRHAAARIKQNRRWLFYCSFAALALSPFLFLRPPETVRANSPFDATDPDGLLPPNDQILTADDVKAAIRSAAMAVNDPRMVIAVTDRQGNPLAIFKKNAAPVTAEGNFSGDYPNLPTTEEVAVALARTASFFSNTQAPLSSRTVRFISGIHFPPGIMFVPQAALYGIENTNRGCGGENSSNVFTEFAADYIQGKEVPAALNIARTGSGLGILTGKKFVDDRVPYPVEANTLKGAVNPGGIPLYKGPNGRLVGGIGVAGIPNVPGDFNSNAGYYAGLIPEYAALVGAAAPMYDSTAASGHPKTLFRFPAYPGVVIIDGISLPFVDKQFVLASATGGRPLPGTQPVPANTPLESLGSFIPLGTKTGEIPPPLTQIVDAKTNKRAAPTSNGKPVTSTSVAYDSPGVVPEGYLVAPKAGSMVTLEDVQTIFNQSLAEANMTRALIRLPVGVRAKFVIAVSDLNGELLGLYRMKDATIFSIDVAVTKSRNVIYFTGQRQANEMPGLPVGTAVTNRTIEFGAQPLYPPGINYAGPGPWFQLFQNDVANPCTEGAATPSKFRSGIVFFPGAVPLYKNGVMVAGLGISGDGVDQDDFATVGGALGYYAPDSMRADQFKVGRNPNGFGPNEVTRLPYTKFPRQPTL
jgi:uncharacterized protein GlcG (DUF336 family)